MLWPLLAFTFVAGARRRMVLVVALVAVSPGSLAISERAYLALYAPILIGCALACAMHVPAGFRWLAKLASGPALLVIFLLTIAAGVGLAPDGYVPLMNIPFALLVDSARDSQFSPSAAAGSSRATPLSRSCISGRSPTSCTYFTCRALSSSTACCQTATRSRYRSRACSSSSD